MKKYIFLVTLLLSFILLTGCCRTDAPQFFPEDELLPVGKVNQPYITTIIVKGPPYRVSYTEILSAYTQLLNESSDPNLTIHVERKKWGNIVTISGTPSKVAEYKIGIHAVRPSTMTCLGESFSNRYILKVTE